MNSKGLLTEREVCMGKYQTEVLTVRTERSEVRKKDQGLIFPIQTEQARLIIHLLYGFEETCENSCKRKLFFSSGKAVLIWQNTDRALANQNSGN